ncbi:hypothetical protein H4R34_001835 [Dimargaris verticillata]|uniref:Tudor domain-containing protein n=1 Tax=Dimargaris verticillata TaxID=2761393 RepID=A0A9W8B9Y3_9FUNG|nr:hypothetical protein H4R34_001835 [Dimargaris verticillata]
MDSQELEDYQYQLRQINLLLKEDPTNAEWLKLQQDLTELIELTQSLSKPSTKELTKTAEAPVWSVGDKCIAKWSGDGQLYEAVVQTVTPSLTVQFLGYGNVETVQPQALKPVAPNQISSPASATNGLSEPVNKSPKAPAPLATEPKKSDEKKRSAKAAKPSVARVQRERQNAWLDFAKKAGKKRKAPAINRKSIFTSPDTVEGKVGVVGSDKPMTKFQHRSKHVYLGEQ